MRVLATTTKVPEMEKLAVQVATSLKIIHRGDKFNLHLKLQNPFDEPIALTGWSWKMPPGIQKDGESPEAREDIELQPNDTRSISFPLKAAGPFWTRAFGFSPQPGEHSLSINISYLKKNKNTHHWQEVEAQLNVYASSLEIYLGAFIGAVLGSLVKKPVLSVNVILSGIVGVFLVLIAKRRSDVQLGISIEDGIGGAVVGFTVGYLGISYFESFLPK